MVYALPASNPAIRPNAALLIDEGAPANTTIARAMPNYRSDNKAVEPSNRLSDLAREFHQKPLTQIYHPRQAPSAVTSENFLAARALISGTFVHNAASTKEARVSNLYKEAPKFREQIDILA
jgi:hypothetical protein